MARLSETERYNIEEIGGIISDLGWMIRETFWQRSIDRSNYLRSWIALIERTYRYIYKGSVSDL